MTDTAPDPSVLVDRRGRAGFLTLNRPRAINALNLEMVRMLTVALSAWRVDPRIQTVVITGAGERGLCAGGDIVSIYQDAIGGGDSSELFWREEYTLNALIARYPKPIVVIQDGIVLGGGIGISAHASHRIVTETSKLGMPETGIGFVPDVGGTWLLARSPGEAGTHLALTAGSVGPADAILLGLSDSFITSADIPSLLTALETDKVTDAVARFASTPPAGVLAGYDWLDDVYRGADLSEIVNRLEASASPAARAAFEAISTKSPTALAVTLASLRRAADAESLEDVLRQEFRVSLRCLKEPDLAEGIRAQVIDKDRNPAWVPAAIGDVEPAHVAAFFAPLDHELELDGTAAA